jgi:cell division protein ZapA
MLQVNIVVNGHAYSVACDEGEEDHLRELGTFVDSKVRDLVASVGQAGDARLILMAALVLADELAEALARVNSCEAELAALKLAVAAERDAQTMNDRAAETLENAAQRIEAIAARLSPP